ncbi:transglycosylase family protein [Candidatus Roizmanbacteria bacterium]|nr:transglycosylase family protein [Candidatus Roizmanbacteria bacterium]
MLKKLIGYLFLSFLFFTACFHTVANANTSARIMPPTPTPTQAPALTPKPSPTAIPTPSPTNTPTPIATPTPTSIPTPSPTPTPVTDLESLFAKYSSQYSIDKNLLKRIADCESHFNPNANYQNIYLGMYQFGEQTWISIRTKMNLDPNPGLRTNAEEAIKTAAYKVSIGGQSAWPHCN